MLRGGKIDAQMGARWRRKFRFVVPVRRPDLWTSIHPVLIETLSFLSDDEYDFEFKPFVQLAPLERCFEFTGEEGLNISPHEVILLFGGLDSLRARSRSSLPAKLRHPGEPSVGEQDFGTRSISSAD